LCKANWQSFAQKVVWINYCGFAVRCEIQAVAEPRITSSGEAIAAPVAALPEIWSIDAGARVTSKMSKNSTQIRKSDLLFRHKSNLSLNRRSTLPASLCQRSS
jgi:hypothetical protein